MNNQRIAYDPQGLLRSPSNPERRKSSSASSTVTQHCDVQIEMKSLIDKAVKIKEDINDEWWMMKSGMTQLLCDRHLCDRRFLGICCCPNIVFFCYR